MGGLPIWIAGVLTVVLIGVGALAVSRLDSSPNASSTYTPSGLIGVEEKPPYAIWLGDSFTEASQVVEDEKYPTIVSTYFGWNYANDGEGGTGYVTDGPDNFPEREPITGHIANVVARDPEYVFVAAGLNDLNRGYTSEQIREAVHNSLTGLDAGLPNAQIFVVGPYWPRGDAIPEAYTVRDIVREEADALGLPFLDPIDGEWVNRDPALIGEDGTHPTTEGQAAIADAIIADLVSRGIEPWVPSS